MSSRRSSSDRAGSRMLTASGFVLVNPLHAAVPVERQENCPYSPVSRLFRSPLYLSIADVPGAAAADLSDLASAATELNDGPWLDRDRTWQLKRVALERIYAMRVDMDRFAAWQNRQPSDLHRFAIWCAISERFGPSTIEWPAELRSFDAIGGVARSRHLRDACEPTDDTHG